MKKQIHLTPEGYDEKSSELEELRRERVNAVAELQRAREMGDLSENAAYKVARSRLSGIDRRIRFLESVMRRVAVAEKPENGIINIGSRVTIDDGVDSIMVTIVDGYESDIRVGKISIYSPIGKTLVGKQKGQTIVVHSPSGRKEYRIVEVE